MNDWQIFRGSVEAETLRREFESSLPTPASQTPHVVERDWLRQLCLTAGAGDAGFVDINRAALGGESEPPWLWWRLGLLVSNPGGGGLLGSIEGCFELCGWDVAAVAVEAVLVEPVHP